jgi:hypothetical protein
MTMTDHVISKELDSELMLYHTEQDAVHVLNPVARRVYELCKKGMSPSEMVEAIRGEFCMPPETEIMPDIQACLAELKEKGLV